ncbi:CatB-related O-acetyltransferase [Modestobacter sp. VKM Ac-2985]|uniref:CatB-related O-acetyltransferase n=1 Tax=Modestobacter sp. VKM Ac-2985 TaxID=3004139 RepID=UPI0022AB61BF|nr:CatB-related O-acetyltransferase [Modestobacter sp. VKM Ac-2985]
MQLCVVFVADTRVSAVQASVHALVPAVDAAESAGGDVDVLVVDSSGRQDVADFLRTVDGARRVRTGKVDRSRALTRALDEVPDAGILWIGGSDGCPVPTAIARMAAAADRDGALVLARPEDPAPHLAGPAHLIRRLWTASDAAGTDPVPELVRRAGAAGVPVIGCAEAGVLKQPIRRPAAPNTSMGPGTYAGASTSFSSYSARDQIEIGAYCSIADDVRVVLPGGRLYDEDGTELGLGLRGLHREQTASTFPIGILVPDEPYDEPPPGATGERLVIGDDVWIGHGAAVLGAVTVGTGSVVGARALVVSDVPPYSVVGGVPARVIRTRFPDDVAARLLRVGWWDWSPEVVKGAHRWFGRPVAEFLDHFDPGSIDADARRG